MFAYSFLAMTAYNVLKPITRAKFIADLGADNLPYVQLAAGVLIGLAMTLYARLVDLLPRRWVIPVTQTALAAVLLVFWLLFRLGGDWVSAAFYLFGLIFGILLISQFWTLANDMYDARQAKRLFGFIGGGASLGGVSGAALTTLAVQTVGTENLLLISAAILGLCAITVVAIAWTNRRAAAGTAGAVPEAAPGGSAQAMRLLRESPHLQTIAVVIGLAAIGAAIIEQQLNMAAEAFKGAGSADAITAFLAQVTLYLSAIGFIIQVALTSRLHRLFGIGFALLILPASLGATALVMLFNAALWAPAAARVLDTSLRYTVDKTTREILFLPLPAALKYEAKPFVDVTVDRFAKGVGALLLLVLIKGFDLNWQQLSFASLGVMALWIAAAARARRQYLNAFRRSIERHEIRPVDIRLRTADLSTIEALVQQLAHRDERRVLYAIDLLEAFEKRHLVTPLLLNHDSEAVRVRALMAIETARPEIVQQWVGAVEAMLTDPSTDVRAAAVRALAAIRKAEAFDLMRPYLNHRDSRLVVTAAVVLARSPDAADVARAEAALRELAADPRPGRAPLRREVARALSEISHESFRDLLLSLVYDTDVEVAVEALRSVRQIGRFDPLFVPVLISLLGHRLLKRDARDVLASYGDAALDPLAYFLQSHDENIWVRRHIPATLARIPSDRSVAILVDALTERDGFVRYKAIAALEKLRREHPEPVIDQQRIQHLVLGESSYYETYVTALDELSGDEAARGSLLARALREKLGRTQDRIYRLLALIHPWREIADARWAIERGSGHLRASAIEYLDNLLSGPLRRQVMPIVEDRPSDRNARPASGIGETRRRIHELLFQLIDDEDEVIGSAAVHLAHQKGDAELRGKLEQVRARTPPGPVAEAAASVLVEAAAGVVAGSHEPGRPLPTVSVADALRHIALFHFVSVDELFRVASGGRQTWYESDRVLSREGEAHDVLHFILRGRIALARAGQSAGEVQSPAALAFEEVVEPCPLRYTAETATPVLSLTFDKDEFFALLADNEELTQGIFRMLLENPVLASWRRVLQSPAAAERAEQPVESLGPLDEVRIFKDLPLFSAADAHQLLDVAHIASRGRFQPGVVTFSEGEPSSICVILSGRLRLKPPGGSEAVIGPGDAIGVYETLVGVPAGCRVEVIEAGAALRIEREDLFDLLASRIDLLRALFSGLCVMPLPAVKAASSQRTITS